MNNQDSKAHPYMPNSAGNTKTEMLKSSGYNNIDDLLDKFQINTGFHQIRTSRTTMFRVGFKTPYTINVNNNLIVRKFKFSWCRDAGNTMSP